MRAPLSHLVASARRPFRGLCEPACASWVWSHVREAFPAAVACSLMPDHLHLVAPAEDEAAARAKLARVLRHVGRRFGAHGFDAVEAFPIRTRKILARTIRYVVRNPCNDGLTDDPLAWPWSTHRDVVGAIADPWVDTGRLADTLAQPHRGFARAHHTYVSRDATKTPEGTPFPAPAVPTELPRHGLPDLARATASALRTNPTKIQTRGPTRHLFIHLAKTTGWTDPRPLAEACQANRTTIWRLTQTPPPPALNAALLCLGDPRLRHRPSAADVCERATRCRR